MKQTNKIRLSNGVSIEDNRHLNCGVTISKQHNQYVIIEYSTNRGFYLRLKKDDFDLLDSIALKKELSESINLLVEIKLKLI